LAIFFKTHCMLYPHRCLSLVIKRSAFCKRLCYGKDKKISIEFLRIHCRKTEYK
jgi:hypothetical protein